MGIKENALRILKEIHKDVTVVAASKSRTVEEILEAKEAGITIFGENYVQEFLEKYQVLKDKVRWHFIGHLQKNKVKKIVGIVDMIQTLDSIKLAEEMEKRYSGADKIANVLIEVNIACEEQKSGILPEDVISFVREVSSRFSYIRVKGLMTMGPLVKDPEELRPYFRRMKETFNEIKGLKLPGVNMEVLSMGMSDSYKIAIEEGANMVRIGTAIFGQRDS